MKRLVIPLAFFGALIFGAVWYLDYREEQAHRDFRLRRLAWDWAGAEGEIKADFLYTVVLQSGHASDEAIVEYADENNLRCPSWAKHIRVKIVW